MMAQAPTAHAEACVLVWAASPHGDLSADQVEALDRELLTRAASWPPEQGSLLCFIHPSGNEASRSSAAGALPTQPRYFLVSAPPTASGSPDELATSFAADIETRLAEPTRLTRHLAALYTPTGSRPVLSALAPHHAPGLMLGLTDCSAPGELASFQRWYDDVHATEPLAPGIFSSARRYELLRPAMPDQCAPQYLALYESHLPGPEALQQLMRPANKPPTPLHATCVLRAVWCFTQNPLPSSP